MNIYREEYIREQARLDARRDAQPKEKKRSRLLQFAQPTLIAGFFIYCGYAFMDILGESIGGILELDFIVAVLALTALFLWARFRG